MTENPEACELLSLMAHLPDGVHLWQDSLKMIAPRLQQPQARAALLQKMA